MLQSSSKNNELEFYIILRVQKSMENDIQKLLIEGSYKTDPQVAQTVQTFRKIVNYLNKTTPKQELLEIALGLMKFYHLPLTICCFNLYNNINALKFQEQQRLKPYLQNNAAFVKSLCAEISIRPLPQLQFFFKWGCAKKKYKTTISPPQMAFSNLICSMSEMKMKMQAFLAKQVNIDQQQKLIHQFLSCSSPNGKPLQEIAIDIMKDSASVLIEKITERQSMPRNNDKSLHKQRKNQKTEQKKVIPHPDQISSTKMLPKIQHNLSSNKKALQNSQISSLKIGESAMSKKKQEIKINQNHICCRTFFLFDQIIEQAQTMHIEYKNYYYPFKDNGDQNPTKRQKIKRTICGFLNAQGGIIYFGIKQDTKTRLRRVSGLRLTESSKVNFLNDIMNLLKDILPDVGKKCTIKYVPIKEERGKNFISGTYIPKVIVQRGANDQLYSYLQYDDFSNRTIQKFSFKTENEVLEMTQIQKVLKIFRNKVLNQPKIHYPLLHSYPCPEPQVGKPSYGSPQQNPNYNGGRSNDLDLSFEYKHKYIPKEEEFPAVGQYYGDDDTDYKSWKDRQEKQRNKMRFKQKDTRQFLVDLSEQELLNYLSQDKISYEQMKIFQQYSLIYLKIKNIKDSFRLRSNPYKGRQVYCRIYLQDLEKDKRQIVNIMMQQFQIQVMPKSVGKETKQMLTFYDGLAAATFMLKLQDAGIYPQFTSQA